MIDDPLSLLALGIWLLAAGMYPVGFLFGVCSACCEPDPQCPWLINFDRCLRVSFFDAPSTGPATAGSHCRISARPGTTGQFGDLQSVADGGVSIHNLQSRITFSVRVNLSATGAARTPVGVTRQQVRRFPMLLSPPASNQTFYDIAGPPWHLQVDLSVTGIEDAQQGTVATSFSTDEYGQPKLIVQVQQSDQPIVHDVPVTLSPVGGQRWSRISPAARNSTVVEGETITGWNVSKLQGLSINERELAVSLSWNTLCTYDPSQPMPDTPLRLYISDQNTALAFLNGEQELRVGNADCRVLPQNVLCQVNDFHAGVALGIYPEAVYRSNPIGSIDQLILPSGRLSSTGYTCQPFGAGWGPVNPDAAPGTAGVVSRGSFFRGGDLLWDLENGPYRTSFTQGNTGDTFTFEVSQTATLIRPSGCADPTPSTIPSLGGTFSYQCRPDLFPNPFVFTFPASRSILPQLLGIFGNTPVLALGNCQIRPLLPLQDPLSTTTLVTAGTCLYFRPEYGYAPQPEEVISTFTVNCPQTKSTVSCDGCALSVEVLAGDDFGRVTLYTSGDLAGLIEIVAQQQWRGGQGVTLRLTCGDLSSEQEIRLNRTAPLPPRNLTVTRTECSVAVLAWDPPEHDGGSPIGNYRVQFRPLGSTQWSAQITVQGTTTTISLPARVGYEFRVLAANGIAQGSYSDIATTGFLLQPPSTVTSQRNAGCDSVTLNWIAPPQSQCVVVDRYQIEYAILPQPYSVFGTVSGTSTTATVTGLSTSVRYVFRIRSVDELSRTSSPSVVSRSPAGLAPTQVTAVLGTTPGSVDVTWQAVDEPCFPHTDYRVRYRQLPSTSYTVFDRPASTSKSATVTGLTPGETYRFDVTAVDASGLGSVSADSNNVTIPA